MDNLQWMGAVRMEEAWLWIMDILVRSDGLNFKRLNDGFVSYKHRFSLDKTCCDVFISCLALILTAPIHRKESIDEQVM